MSNQSASRNFSELLADAAKGDELAVAIGREKVTEVEKAFVFLTKNNALEQDIVEAQETFMWAKDHQARIEEAYNMFIADRDAKNLAHFKSLASKAHKILGIRTKYTPSSVLAFIPNDERWVNHSIPVTFHKRKVAVPNPDVLFQGHTLCTVLPVISDGFAAQLHININKEKDASIHIYEV